MAAAEQQDSDDDGNPWASYRGNWLHSSTVAFVNQKAQKQLRKAVWGGDLAQVDRLLQFDAGCSVHDRDNGGKTVVNYAAGQGNVEMIDLLIMHRADVNAHSNDGETPMDEAVYWALKKLDSETRQCSRDYLQTVDLILDHGGMHSDVTRYLELVQLRSKLDKKEKQNSAARASTDSGWRKSFDHVSGSVYYGNIWTGESQWHKPDGWEEPAGD